MWKWKQMKTKQMYSLLSNAISLIPLFSMPVLFIFLFLSFLYLCHSCAHVHACLALFLCRIAALGALKCRYCLSLSLVACTRGCRSALHRCAVAVLARHHDMARGIFFLLLPAFLLAPYACLSLLAAVYAAALPCALPSCFTACYTHFLPFCCHTCHKHNAACARFLPAWFFASSRASWRRGAVPLARLPMPLSAYRVLRHIINISSQHLGHLPRENRACCHLARRLRTERPMVKEGEWRMGEGDDIPEWTEGKWWRTSPTEEEEMSSWRQWWQATTCVMISIFASGETNPSNHQNGVMVIIWYRDGKCLKQNKHQYRRHR